MKIKLGSLLATIVGVALLAGPQVSTQAANIITGAEGCQPLTYLGYLPAPNEIGHVHGGVHNTNPDRPLDVVCTIPRSPRTTDTGGIFYVDGDNFNGASTTCVLYSYDYTGTYLGQTSATSFDAHFDMALTLPAAQVPTWAYISIRCTLPPHSNGLLRGVASVQ